MARVGSPSSFCNFKILSWDYTLPVPPIIIALSGVFSVLLLVYEDYG